MADDLSPGLTAKQMLERQLAALGSLYNAGVRSPNFREWRQATLTCIQRIWSADPAKSERFRRIPFSPPMGRPADREVREYYERGCGEAASLLKGMIKEIETVGVPNQGAGAPGAMAPLPGGPDDDFPTLELPGSSGASGGGSAPTPPTPPKPRLKDLLGFTELSGPDHASDGPPVAAGAPPLPSPPAAAPPAAGAPPLPSSPAAAPPAAGAPPLPSSPAAAPPAAPAPPAAAVDALASSAAQAMADFESQGFFAPPPGRKLREPSAAAPAAPPGHMLREPSAATPAAPTPATSAVPVSPKIVVTGAAPPAGPPPVPAPAPAAPSAAGPGDGNDLERIADDLLRSSSALSSLPRRQAPDRPATPRDIRSPIPIAIAALAQEVESLGIPDGHRARARAVLLDLSRRLDAPNLKWDALREAMSFIMEFPALGRRIVPLLLPYFDRAA